MITVREVLKIMRGATGPNINGVRLSRAYGRRRYFLDVGDNRVWTGHAAMLDTTTGELWVKPNAYMYPDTEDAIRSTLKALQTVQREHGIAREDIAAAHPDHLPYVLNLK